jgi:PleD family two-component response regulator
MRVPADQPVVEALRSADQALYRAKADGRNCVRLYA